jgi:hypothetical protein
LFPHTKVVRLRHVVSLLSVSYFSPLTALAIVAHVEVLVVVVGDAMNPALALVRAPRRGPGAGVGKRRRGRKNGQRGGGDDSTQVRCALSRQRKPQQEK